MRPYIVDPIGDRPAPHVCDHHAMPGDCLAPACENYWKRPSFRGVPFPDPVPISRPHLREATTTTTPRAYKLREVAKVLHERCSVCKRRIPNMRFRRGDKFCSETCEHEVER